ncbi:N-acetylmuramoyl-L-alanine amidase [Deinococcus kurensis]|uniref:N-acetylmuramoyl-L-alanine amidase n=1 Tax=Deinococcus kurensis TaxID=2662757 RepID=UPI0012D2C899|nr:N-acetylmuramoyl-L-alanine amidase [Deinococcus kurensis]
MALNITQVPAHPTTFDVGRGGAQVDRVVVHVTDGTFTSAVNTFQNPDPKRPVSAHYVISETGAITQMVADSNTAFHAGLYTMNARSIGIEHAGVQSRTGKDWWKPTKAQFRASAELTAGICTRFGIEPSLSTLIGHSAVNPDRADRQNCPGPGWVWTDYVALVKSFMPTATRAGSVFYPLSPWADILQMHNFNAEGYMRKYKAWHTGEDLNNRLGNGEWPEGDVNMPVYAVADGVVEMANTYPTWGNVVLLRHDNMPDLDPATGKMVPRTFWTQYAHLNFIDVYNGMKISAGTQVGGVGAGDPAADFGPHLHFEVRKKKLKADNWPGLDRSAVEDGYEEPLAWLKRMGAVDLGGKRPQQLHPRLVSIREDMIQWLARNKPHLSFHTLRAYVKPAVMGRNVTRSGGQDTGYQNPHTVLPALAFDFVIKRRADGTRVPSSDPLYALLADVAVKSGGVWGATLSEPVPGEGKPRDHIELPSAQAVIDAARYSAASGDSTPGEVGEGSAAAGSDSKTSGGDRPAPCKNSRT